MVFAHDTEVALHAAAALVNTLDGDEEKLTDVSALDEFVTAWGWTGSRRRTRAELAEVRAMRPRLREVWTADVDAAVGLLNAILADAHALPQLVKHDALDYHLHATAPTAPLADRMAVEAAMALVDVIRTGEFDRLRVCAADDCDNLVVDLSKNRSRRFCDAGCGNRLNVANYRARRNRSASA